MKKALYIVKGTALVIVLFEVFLFISGNSYVNDVLEDTVFKGRLGPGIDNYTDFPFREIKATNHQPWNEAFDYNKVVLANEEDEYLKELQTTAFLVVHQDSIVYESYWDEFADNSITNSFSAAKSIVSILIGIAIEEVKIKSVNQKLMEFLPEYDVEFGRDITLKDLLTMSSGINFNENYINPFSFPAKSYYGYDIKGLVKEYQPENIPGKTWRYRGGDTQLLAFVLEKATGMKISEYAAKKLWNPIGAKHSAFWSTDGDNGDEKASCCFNSNARDFARLGKLYLNNGSWDSVQIVNKQFVQESIAPASHLTTVNGEKVTNYGYQWWLMTHNGNNVFYARGILGQYIIVVPEKELIIIRLGHKRERTKKGKDPIDAKKYLDFALKII